LYPINRVASFFSFSSLLGGISGSRPQERRPP
jgi:hypothetical protein